MTFLLDKAFWGYFIQYLTISLNLKKHKMYEKRIYISYLEGNKFEETSVRLVLNKCLIFLKTPFA